MSKEGRPVLAIVGRNLGDSNLKFDSGKEPLTSDDLVHSLDRDITVGFSMTPQVMGGELNVALDMRHLNNEALEFNKKTFFGLEYAYGGIAKDALLAIRLGASAAGLSGGFKLGTGLINLEASISNIDISQTNDSFIENRKTVLFTINVRE